MLKASTPLRVGLVTYGMLSGRSGGYLYDYYLVEQLLKQKLEVRLFPQKEPRKAGAIHCLTDNFDSSFLDSVLSFAPHILLEDELNHASLYLLNRKIKKLAKPIQLVGIVHHLRCNEYRQPWQYIVQQTSRIIEKDFLNTLDGCIFNSYDTRASVTAILKRELPSVLAYPGKDRYAECSHPGCSRQREKRAKLNLLFIGNIIPRKGLHILLSALADIPARDWHLTVIGRWDVAPGYTRQIRRQIKNYHLEEAVTFTGFVQDKTLVDIMHRQEMLVVPSFMEGFGLVYLEAMGAGLPVLACSQGGARELVHEQINGFLISPGDTGAIYRIINRLIHDRTELYRLRQGALATYACFPTWSESMLTIYQFLIRLLCQTC